MRLTVGVPQIVPLLSPRLNPSGRGGTNVQLAAFPSTRAGEMGEITVPLSRVNSVWEYVTVGLPSRMVNETVICMLPASVSFIHIVNAVSDIFATAVPEMTPVSEFNESPLGRGGEISQLSKYSAPPVSVAPMVPSAVGPKEKASP